jgi:hypothetical protein
MHFAPKFTMVSSVKPGLGDTFAFWTDKWKFMDSSEPLSSRFPRLFSFVLDKDFSAAEVYAKPNPSQLFYLPLSAQAYQEFTMVQQGMVDWPLSTAPDVWVYEWGDKFLPSRYYASLHAHLLVPPVFKWIWKFACMMNSKVFAWLLLNDRLNTKDLLVRRNWKVAEDNYCKLCPTRSYEDRLHMFFMCNFSCRICNYLQIDWLVGDDTQSVVAAAKKDFRRPFVMEVMILACWNIWKVRNGKIFTHERHTFAKWKCNFIHDISLLQHRIKSKHIDSLMSWIHSLP